MAVDETIEKTETSVTRPGTLPPLCLVPQEGGRWAFEAKKLRPGVMYIGRVPNNDVVLESELVSRRHAKLIVTDLGVTIHDLDSHNGVFIDGQKVRSAPVAEGQKLYIADVCCVLQADETSDGSFELDVDLNQSDIITAAFGDARGDPPAVRNLATLYRCTDLLLTADDADFRHEVMAALQALTEASVAVLVKMTESGALSTEEALGRGGQPALDPAVSWPVVRRAISERVALFSRDAAADPLVDDVLVAEEKGAVMCIPILREEGACGAIYLSRPFAGTVFTDREVETVSAIAHLLAIRIFTPSTLTWTGSSLAADVELSELREKVALLTRELELAQSTANEQGDAQTKVDALLDKLAEAARALEASQQAESALRAQLESQRVEEGRDSASQVELEELKRQHETLTHTLLAAERDLDAATAQSRLLADELETTQRDVEELQSQVDSEQARVVAVVAERDRARTDCQALEAQLEDERNRVDTVAVTSGIRDDERAILRGLLTARLAAYVEARLEDQPLPMPASASSVLVCMSLSGLDAWAEQASLGEVKARLDWLFERVSELASHEAGALEQVLGHTLLLRFPAGSAGVQRAVRCAVRAQQEAQGTGAAMQVGVHLGNGISGVFAAGALAHVGEASAVARSAADFAQPGTIYISEAVRTALPNDSGFSSVALGPHIIRGLAHPVNLFQLVVPGGSV